MAPKSHTPSQRSLTTLVGAYVIWACVNASAADLPLPGQSETINPPQSVNTELQGTTLTPKKSEKPQTSSSTQSTDSSPISPPPSLEWEQEKLDQDFAKPIEKDAIFDLKKEAAKPEEVFKEEKEKKWYDTLSIRGYAQFRHNEVMHKSDGSAAPNYAGDSSIDEDRNFIIRRARLVFSGKVHDRVAIYLQPDFASSVPNSPDAEYFVQIRDWYTDLYITKDEVHRFRVGQSKIPYGWENLQSSSNRIVLDRNDGMNSAQRNERDLGIFYYYTPEWVQEIYDEISDKNLKGSGNYGMFGAGIYNGQGGSFRDRNDNVHFVTRLSIPFVLPNCQIVEVGVQGYTGDYVVLGSAIQPHGVGPAITPGGTGDTDGHKDQRIGTSLIIYPQPIGFQAEWNVGRGPALNEAQTQVIDRPLYGGYAMLFSKHDFEDIGTLFPFARYNYYKGGYKSSRNAPFGEVNDWELGVEWQINKAIELTTSYLIADRTNLNSLSSGESYRSFDGDVLRFQLQVNY